MLNLIKSFARRSPVLQARMRAHSSAMVRYQTSVLNADGSVAKRNPWRKNLILDQGLNNVATNVWTNMFSAVAVGTGTNPVKRDSAATTFTRAGTTVTASANFFEAADVGRLLKFDTGEEMYITVFTDAQNVTVGTSGTLGASEGTIWYVNRTGLQTETKRSTTTSGGGALNLSTFSVDTWTHQRQFLFTAEGAPVTYREIGWSHTGSAGANLFGMDLIPGAGDSLLTGQQYQVIVQLIVTYTPNGIQTQADVGSGGFDTSGTWAWQFVGQDAVSTLAQSAIAPMDPGGDGFTQRCVALTQALTLLTAMTDSGSAPSSSAGFGTSTSRSAYTSGTFFRDITANWGVTEAIGTLTGFTWGSLNGGGTSPSLLSPMPFVVKFTAGQTKDSLHTLQAVLRLSWGRILTN